MLAAAAVPLPATALVPLRSAGVTLVLGRDAVALDAAARLASTLDVTVLLTGTEADVDAPGVAGDGVGFGDHRLIRGSGRGRNLGGVDADLDLGVRAPLADCAGPLTIAPRATLGFRLGTGVALIAGAGLGVAALEGGVVSPFGMLGLRLFE